VAESIAEGFRQLLLPLADPATSDHHVVLVDHAVDPNGAESELIYAHCHGRSNVRYILSIPAGATTVLGLPG
jgi:hypothetical protein